MTTAAIAVNGAVVSPNTGEPVLTARLCRIPAPPAIAPLKTKTPNRWPFDRTPLAVALAGLLPTANRFRPATVRVNQSASKTIAAKKISVRRLTVPPIGRVTASPTSGHDLRSLARAREHVAYRSKHQHRGKRCDERVHLQHDHEQSVHGACNDADDQSGDGGSENTQCGLQ